METTTGKPVWYVASKVKLVYKTKVKNSERPSLAVMAEAGIDLYASLPVLLPISAISPWVQPTIT